MSISLVGKMRNCYFCISLYTPNLSYVHSLLETLKRSEKSGKRERNTKVS